MAQEEFTWRDGERTISFRRGAIARARELLGEHGWERYELLTTARALAEAPLDLAEGAAAVHEVPAGPVNETSASLLAGVTTPSLVALGGGRVIDTAKAIAAVRGGRVAAFPTTLSGAEMTRIHRLPEGHSAPHLVRPVLVGAEPEAMTGLDEPRLRASAMNALAHGAEPLYTPLSNPVATMASLRGAELIASALDAFAAGALPGEGRRDLALGSLLCAYALDSAMFALHHVVCQTLVRKLAIPHAETNATMLPHTMAAMRDRAPEPIAALAGALGTEPGGIFGRIEALGGGPRTLSGLGAERERLEAAVDAIMRRGELGMTPDPPDRDEVRELVEAAW